MNNKTNPIKNKTIATSVKSIIFTVLFCGTTACTHLNLPITQSASSTQPVTPNSYTICETPAHSQLVAACLYPDPKKVLALQQALSLTPAQLQQTQAIYDEMKRYSDSLQAQLESKRQQLDSQFQSQQINDDNLAALLTEISINESKLRYVYLGAYLKQFKVLTTQQRAHYHRIQESFSNR